MVCFIEFLLFLICGLLSIILILKFFIWMVLDLTEKEKIKRARETVGNEIPFSLAKVLGWEALFGFPPPLRVRSLSTSSSFLFFYWYYIWLLGYRVLTFPDFVSNQTRFYWHTNLDFLSIVSSFSISLSGYNALFFFSFFNSIFSLLHLVFKD